MFLVNLNLNLINTLICFYFISSESLVQKLPGTPNAICAYDVYCFGKVLLELVTGKLGMKDWLETTLPYISIYDKELVTNILDPSLIIDEDLLGDGDCREILPEPEAHKMAVHLGKPSQGSEGGQQRL